MDHNKVFLIQVKKDLDTYLFYIIYANPAQ